MNQHGAVAAATELREPLILQGVDGRLLLSFFLLKTRHIGAQLSKCTVSALTACLLVCQSSGNVVHSLSFGREVHAVGKARQRLKK